MTNKKLTDKQKAKIVELRQQGHKIVEINRLYPWVTPQAISRICNPMPDSTVRIQNRINTYKRLKAIDARVLLAQGLSKSRVAALANTSIITLNKWLELPNCLR
jgi:hypothetical protein